MSTQSFVTFAPVKILKIWTTIIVLKTVWINNAMMQPKDALFALTYLFQYLEFYGTCEANFSSLSCPNILSYCCICFDMWVLNSEDYSSD